MFLSKGRTGTKNGTEIVERVNWGMALPGDISCLQTPNPTLLLWSRDRNQVWHFVGKSS